jgi:hypothetical protein
MPLDLWMLVLLVILSIASVLYSGGLERLR